MYSSTLLVHKLIHITMIALGDFQNVRTRTIYTILVYCSGFLLVLGSLVGFFTTNSGIVDKLTAFCSLSLGCFSLIIVIQISYKRKDIKILISKIKNKDGMCGDYVCQYANILTKKKLIHPLAIMVVAISIPLSNIVLQLIQKGPISNKYSLILPFWFSCGDDEIQNIIKNICYPIRTTSQLLLVNGVLLILASVIAITVIGATILYSITIYELLAHVNIIKSRITTINQVINRHFHLEWNELMDERHTKKQQQALKQNEEAINEHLIAIIKYQQFLKSCVGSIVDTWNEYSASFITNHFITSFIFVYTIIKEGDEALLVALRASGMMSFNCIVFTLICSHGHVISQLNEALFDELSKVSWYKLSTKFRKVYGIALTLNHQSTKIKMFNTYEIGLCTMESLVRTTYSAVNLLLKMQNKRDM